MSLRPYQAEALEGARARYRQGERAALIVLPTGCGKTRTALTACGTVVQRGGRVLWLAHRAELVHQPIETWQTLPWLADAGTAGVVMADEDDHGAALVCASVQTLASGDRLSRVLSAGLPDLVVVDEAHHSTAGQWRTVLDRIDEHVGEAGGRRPKWLGLTATPERTDGEALHTLWGDEPAFVYTYNDAIDEGYLCPPSFVLDRLQLDDETRDLLAQASADDDEAEMARLLLRAGVVEHTVASMGAHLVGRRALLFTADVEQAERTVAALKDAGWTAAVVSGKTPKAKRRALLRMFTRGEIQVLANCAVLTEGTDLPCCDAIVAARPFASKPLWVQAVGRGLRLHPGKTSCLVLDLVGASEEHSLVMAAGMMGTEGAGKRKAFTGRTQRRVGGLPPFSRVKVAPVGDDEWQMVGWFVGEALAPARDVVMVAVPDDVTPETGESEPTVRVGDFWRERVRVMADWVPLNHGSAWACDCGDAGLVMLLDHSDGQDSGNTWMAYLLPKQARKPRAMGRRLCSEEVARSLGDDLFRQAGKIASRNAAWKGRPPTDKAVAYAERLGANVDGLSAGDVARAITQRKALRHLDRLGLDGFASEVAR